MKSKILDKAQSSPWGLSAYEQGRWEYAHSAPLFSIHRVYGVEQDGLPSAYPPKSLTIAPLRVRLLEEHPNGGWLGIKCMAAGTVESIHQFGTLQTSGCLDVINRVFKPLWHAPSWPQTAGCLDFINRVFKPLWHTPSWPPDKPRYPPFAATLLPRPDAPAWSAIQLLCFLYEAYAFKDALIHGIGKDIFKVSGFPDFHNAFKALEQLDKLQWPTSKNGLPTPFHRFCSALTFDIKGGTWSGNFFVTSTGHLGIGPEATKIGDNIIVACGARSAWIVRPVEDKYALIGDSYVSGWMHGEVKQLEKRDEVDFEEIVLL